MRMFLMMHVRHAQLTGWGERAFRRRAILILAYALTTLIDGTTFASGGFPPR